MAEEKIINAVKRDTKGTSNARRLRVLGSIPAVVYGAVENQPIAIDTHAFGLMVRDFGQNFVGDLVVDGATSQKVLLKDVQYHPASGTILHADFVAISMTEKLQVSLPIKVSGEAAGAIAGGILEQLLAEIEIECLPGDMVETIVVDVTDLEIGSSIHVSDLDMPEGVVVLSDGELAVVQVSAPRVVADADEAVETAGEEGAEEGDKPATEEKTKD